MKRRGTKRGQRTIQSMPVWRVNEGAGGCEDVQAQSIDEAIETYRALDWGGDVRSVRLLAEPVVKVV